MSNNNKKPLTFYPSDYKTKDELLQQIEERNEKMLKNINEIRQNWKKFKSDVVKIQNKKKKTDTKIYSICFTGIAICFIMLMILEWVK